MAALFSADRCFNREREGGSQMTIQ